MNKVDLSYRPGVDQVHAHRGASAVAPENTRAAFKAAQGQGARWIEFDATLLGDGNVVIIHDAAVDRCSTSKGAIADLKLADLADIDAGAWFDAVYRNERIPTLDEALACLAEFGLHANLEIKLHPHVDVKVLTKAVHEALQKRDPAVKVMISSFSVEALQLMKSYDQNYDVAMLWSELPENWLDVLASIPAKAIHINYRALSFGFLEATQKHGIVVRAWTCNTPDLLAPFWSAGLAGVITDDPRVFLT